MAEKSQILFLWKQIRDKAEGVIPPVSFNTFIKDLEPDMIFLVYRNRIRNILFQSPSCVLRLQNIPIFHKWPYYIKEFTRPCNNSFYHPQLMITYFDSIAKQIRNNAF